MGAGLTAIALSLCVLCLLRHSRHEVVNCSYSLICTHIISSFPLPVLNQFMHKLDNRYERSLKTTKSSTIKRDRVMGLPSTSHPPLSLPSWMVDPNYKMPAPAPPTSTSVCMESSSDPENSSSECVCAPMQYVAPTSKYHPPHVAIHSLFSSPPHPLPSCHIPISPPPSLSFTAPTLMSC